MLRLGSTDSTYAEVGPALQQRPTVAFDCNPLRPPAHGDCVCAGQQPSPVEHASTGMAAPTRLNQMARMAVSRRNTCSTLCGPDLQTLDPAVSSVKSSRKPCAAARAVARGRAGGINLRCLHAAAVASTQTRKSTR
jgi:hypothetical protein